MSKRSLTDLEADAQAFKRTRIQLGCTQQDLALQLGVTRVTVSRWENGKRRIGTRTWLALESLLQGAGEEL